MKKERKEERTNAAQRQEVGKLLESFCYHKFETQGKVQKCLSAVKEKTQHLKSKLPELDLLRHNDTFQI